MENWQLNISLIPSIAVILASSNRMALGLTDEISLRLLANLEMYKEILPLKISQLKRLSLSITLMYISLALLVVNALLSALNIIKESYEMFLVIVAISFFLAGLILKVQFSYYAYKIRQKQFFKFVNRHD